MNIFGFWQQPAMLRLLLVLHSEITPGGTEGREDIWDVEGQILSDFMQGNYPTHCTISLVALETLYTHCCIDSCEKTIILLLSLYIIYLN